MMLYNFINYLLSYNLRFNRLYRRRAKFLPFKKGLFLKLFRLRMLKKTIQVNKRNKIPIIKSVGLDLTLIIGADFNLITLQKNNVSRIYSPKVTLVSPKIIIGRNLIQINGTWRYMSVITITKKAI
jgi:hypothetical protein